MHREARGGFSDFINVCFHLMNARSPTGSNLAVDLYACSAVFRQISLYYTLLHIILINYCGTGCIRRLGNYSKSIKLVQNTHWILQHIKSCSTWFRQSILWIQRFRLTQSHCHSLTQPHCHWVWDWQTESHGRHAAAQLSCLWPGPWAWQHCHYVWYLSSDK